MPMPAWLARLLPGRRARSGMRRFDAAQYNRLTHNWIAAERSINTELRSDLDALRRRSRDLARNAPLAKKFLQMCVTNIVGPRGFVLQARAAEGKKPDELANTAIETAWADWSKAKNCDVAGRLSFAQMTRAIAKAVARDGEALIRVRQGAANPYGYALQLLDIERLDTTLNRQAENGKNAIILGVEIDGDGRPVAYWLTVGAPGSDPTGKTRARIPAAEILHLFFTDDPEQMRGIPWMHASMLTVNDLKGYNHAAIVAARVGASKMGFFTSPDGDPNPLSDGDDAAGMPFMEADPGQFGMLPPGYDFKSFDPDYPHANYDAFVKAHKRDVATGFGVAYNSLANDLEGVNFSSIRSGTLEERDNWMIAQAEFIEQFCDVVFEGWLDNALLSGAILMPNGSALPAAKRQKFLAHEFQGRRWQWVDPLKDVEASVKAIENGLASPYSIIAQQGLDADEVLTDIARFQAAAADKGVKLGKPELQPTPIAAPEPDEDDASKALLVALASRAAEKPDPQQPTTINVAPVINLPETRNEITTPPPVVNVEVASPEVRNEIITPAPVVNIAPSTAEVRIDNQPAVVNVAAPNVTLEMPDRMTMDIASMPTRETTSRVERDKNGNIKSTTQTESDV